MSAAKCIGYAEGAFIPVFLIEAATGMRALKNCLFNHCQVVLLKREDGFLKVAFIYSEDGCRYLEMYPLEGDEDSCDCDCFKNFNNPGRIFPVPLEGRWKMCCVSENPDECRKTLYLVPVSEEPGDVLKENNP